MLYFKCQQLLSISLYFFISPIIDTESRLVFPEKRGLGRLGERGEGIMCQLGWAIVPRYVAEHYSKVSVRMFFRD